MSAITANDVGLLFRIRADSTDAERSLKGFTNSLLADATKLGTEGTSKLGSFGSALESLAGPAAIAAAVIATIGVAAVEVGEKLFSMAEEASKVGREMAGLQTKTGLSAEAISALASAAHLSGKSLSDIQRPLVQFNEQLVKAQTEGGKTAALLHKMGVTDFRDFEGSLNQVTIAMNEASAGQDKLHAAVELFGKRGGPDFISVMKKMGDSLEEAKEHAIKMGEALSEEDLTAAKEFGKAWDTIARQVEIGATKFALAYAPEITAALRNISSFLADNKEQWVEWGRSIGEVVNGAVIVMQYAGNAINAILFAMTSGLVVAKNSWVSWAIEVANALFPIARLLAQISNLVGTPKGQLGANLNIPEAGFSVPKGGGGGGRGGGGKGASAGKDTALQDAEADMRQRIALIKNADEEEIAILDQMLKRKQIRERDYLTAIHDIKQQEFQAEIDAYQKILETQTLTTKQRIDLETKIKVLKSDAYTEEIKSETKLQELKTKDAEENRKSAEDADREDKEYANRRYKRFMESRLQRLQANLEERDRQRALAQEQKDRSFGGMLGGLGMQRLKDVFDKDNNLISKGLSTLGTSFLTLKRIGVDAFGALAQGLGQMVEQWVLMGDSGPDAMRKLVASVLAGVAAQSATLAIFELAKGFAALFWNPPEAAAHFTAAALFGGLAAVSAVAGRAVAGDAFKQQTSAATGGGSSSGSGGSRNGGSYYSSKEDQTLGGSRNTPGGFPPIRIELGLDKNGILKVLKSNTTRNGPFRTLIRDTR